MMLFSMTDLCNKYVSMFVYVYIVQNENAMTTLDLLKVMINEA